jgi:hypothetical protein
MGCIVGYRSDVAITAYGNKEKLVELKAYYDAEVEKLGSDGADDLNSLVGFSIDTTEKPLWNEDGEFFFYTEHRKWYCGYPAVDLISSVFDTAKELGLIAEFVRVGEECDDNEERYEDDVDGNCEYRLSISRSISF